MVKEKKIACHPSRILSAEDAFQLLKTTLDNKDREYFIVLTLDVKNQPLNLCVCHIGSLNESLIHPREIVKTAVLSNAFSIVIAHNHTSGICEPSEKDIHATHQIQEACCLLGIELLDHLIIGNGQFQSFKRLGLL